MSLYYGLRQQNILTHPWIIQPTQFKEDGGSLTPLRSHREPGKFVVSSFCHETKLRGNTEVRLHIILKMLTSLSVLVSSCIILYQVLVLVSPCIKSELGQKHAGKGRFDPALPRLSLLKFLSDVVIFKKKRGGRENSSVFFCSSTLHEKGAVAEWLGCNEAEDKKD